MSLNDFLIRRKVGKMAAVSVDRPHASIPLEKSENMLLLCVDKDREEMENALNDFRKRYRGKIHTCIYVDRKKDPDTGSMIVNALKCRNLSGFPRSEIIKQFQEIPADILVDLTPPDCYLMKYLMLLHPCNFKAGVQLQDMKNNGYDLTVSVTANDNIREIIEHLLFYLRAIRSK